MLTIGSYATKTTVLSLLLFFQLHSAKDKVTTLHGAITDSQCAYNVHSDAHSHEWMIKKGVQGAHDDKSCTLHCVRNLGGLYVLILKDKDDVFHLDDQAQAEAYAGKTVRVTGTLDGKTHTLHIQKIEEEH